MCVYSIMYHWRVARGITANIQNDYSMTITQNINTIYILYNGFGMYVRQRQQILNDWRIINRILGA